jgi:hypothetical protein
VLRKIFAPKREELRNGRCHSDLYSFTSYCYMTEIKELTMGWTCSLGDMRYTCRILVTKFATWSENNMLRSLRKPVLRMCTAPK